MTEGFSAFKVNKVSWASSNVQYYLIFYRDRMVFAKIGGQFAEQGLGAVTGAVLGGAIGAMIGGAVDSRLGKKSNEKKTKKMRDFFEMSPEEILAQDKKNYQIFFNDVKKVSMKQSRMGVNGARAGVFEVEHGKKEKFDIVQGQRYSVCEDIVREHLANKM
jgi:hypothetical protein